MFEITPLIIAITIVLAVIIGGVVGRFFLKSSYKNKKRGKNSEHRFHVDSATGIVSDITSFKY
jgi:uncharacterized membrane protein YqiK